MGKEEIKLSLFVNDLILRIENPEESTKNLFDLINKFSKGIGYEINIQNSVAFIYPNNELSEKEIKKTTSFMRSSKTIEYLVINLRRNISTLKTIRH